ncbi:MAG: DUF1016 N-terminal domain-containing protein, partial [Bifidobacteriaceae bacterium]|nr:DUF1016 N-terminal domain-containing protein [Bifidobacteriaceae bacterium]
MAARFGRGFSVRNLYLMRSFRLGWPPERILQTVSAESADPEIPQTVSAESPSHVLAASASALGVDSPLWAQVFPLPWSAYVRLLAVNNDHAREFYETEALRNGWTIEQLKRQIDSQFYERTALSRN